MEQKDLEYITKAHSNHAKKPSKTTRKWDGKTPYYIHPLWCATMIAMETGLDERTRIEGILVLLYHDILEDTTQPLPEHLPERLKQQVQSMTFRDSEDEMEKIWSKPKEILLYKLYDKVSNLLDGGWMSPEKRASYEDYTRRLCIGVENHYGELNITRIARSITK